MKSLAELQAIRDKARASVNLRENAEAETRVLVGMATCGIAAGARPVLNAFVEEVNKRGLKDTIDKRILSAQYNRRPCRGLLAALRYKRQPVHEG